EVHVPILVGINVETYATKKYDLEKSKDESRYELKLHKPIPKVFKPNGQTARATETSTKLAGEELVYQASPIHTFTLSTYGAAATQPEGESAEISSAMP
ncbi:hypothetical protein HAX54_010477, partial [Datura stramonium]|nr:hypothetical protein [Datura stramonium]